MRSTRLYLSISRHAHKATSSAIERLSTMLDRRAEPTPPYLTEIMLLGVAALKAGTRLFYDGASMRVTNNGSTNDFLRRDYHQGFGLS